MRAILLSFIALALASPVFSLTLPNSISLRETATAKISKNLPRAVGDKPSPSFPDHCDNGPDAKAGIISTPPPSPQPRHRRSLQPRVGTRIGVWCLPTTRIYVRVVVTHPSIGPLIPALLAEAFSVVHDTILHLNDGIITPAGFSWRSTTTGLALHVVNTNGEQLRWGVLETALQATYGVMARTGWGAGLVTIFEGAREVGSAVIGVRSGS